MIRHRLLPRALLVTLALLPVTGCVHPRRARIAQNQEVFAALPPASQRLVEAGLVAPGFPSAAVFLALGNPTSRSSQPSARGPVETWTYRNFVLDTGMSVRITANNPGARYQARTESPASPTGPSLHSTAPYGPQPSLDTLAGAATGTLHVDLLHDEVIALRWEP